jgi:hypothetical protein
MTDSRAKQESLEAIFRQLRAGEVPEDSILTFALELDVSDVGWLMEFIERLNGLVIAGRRGVMFPPQLSRHLRDC